MVDGGTVQSVLIKETFTLSERKKSYTVLRNYSTNLPFDPAKDLQCEFVHS